jgi:hypothetical protein
MATSSVLKSPGSIKKIAGWALLSGLQSGNNKLLLTSSVVNERPGDVKAALRHELPLPSRLSPHF